MPEENTPSAPPLPSGNAATKSTAPAPPAPAPPTVTHDGKMPEDIPEADMPPPPVLDDESVPKPPKLKKSPKGLMVVLVVIGVLALAGALGWFFFMRDSGQPAQQSQAPAAEETQASDDDVPEATNTETFTSDPYRATFMYPKTWEVTENNDNSILVQSENFTYKTVSGESKEGNFRVAIRKGATTADSEIIAKGVAIQASEKLIYTAPAPGQRTETNLSLFGKDKVDNFSFLLITSNFTLQKGDTLGPNFGKETDAFLISGGYSETGLEPGLATNQVSVDGAKSTNAYKQAIAIIQSLQIK